MNDPNDPNFRPRDHRNLGIGLAIAACVLLVYASFSHRWLENTHYRGTRIGFSLLALELCMDDKCQDSSNFTVMAEAKKAKSESASGMFAPMGVATMALSLLSVLALLGSAVLAYQRRRVSFKLLPSTVALLALMTALITACLFVAKKPGGVGAVGVGPSFWAFAIACVVGIVAGQLLQKLIKPIDPDLEPTL